MPAVKRRRKRTGADDHKQNVPTRLIAFKMGRTPEAIYRKAKQKGISLKSTGQLPYGTKKW